jgi:hypothetical protein
MFMKKSFALRSAQGSVYFFMSPILKRSGSRRLVARSLSLEKLLQGRPKAIFLLLEYVKKYTERQRGTFSQVFE